MDTSRHSERAAAAIEVHVRTRAGPTSGPLVFTHLVGRTGAVEHSRELTLTVAPTDPVAALKRAICEQPHVGPALDPDALLLFLVRITSSTRSETSASGGRSKGQRGSTGTGSTSEAEGSYVPLGMDAADDERSLADVGVTHGACVELVFPRPGLVQLVVEFRMTRTTSLFVRTLQFLHVPKSPLSSRQ